LATALSSVGPCFVGPLFGDHRFDELTPTWHRGEREFIPSWWLPRCRTCCWQSVPVGRATGSGAGSARDAVAATVVPRGAVPALAVARQSRAIWNRLWAVSQ
jgi:hypothetical protein